MREMKSTYLRNLCPHYSRIESIVANPFKLSNVLGWFRRLSVIYIYTIIRCTMMEDNPNSDGGKTNIDYISRAVKA